MILLSILIYILIGCGFFAWRDQLTPLSEVVNKGLEEDEEIDGINYGSTEEELLWIRRGVIAFGTIFVILLWPLMIPRFCIWLGTGK